MAAEGTWVVPGVDRPRPLGPAALVAPRTLPAPVLALQEAAEALRSWQPADLDDAQVLAATAALVAAEQIVLAVRTRALAQVEQRRLHLLADARSVTAWLRQEGHDLPATEVTLARKLAVLPALADRLAAGQISVAVAQRLQAALSRLRPFVDRPDGLIDGQDGEQALYGVIVHGVRDLACAARGGFAGDDDPALVALCDRLLQLYESGASQLARLEAAFLVLAEQVEPGLLRLALESLADALLPAQLEERARRGEQARQLTLVRKADGTGWHICGDLDLAAGEALHAVLQAELVRDLANPTDTEDAAQLRGQGLDPYDSDLHDTLPDRYGAQADGAAATADSGPGQSTAVGGASGGSATGGSASGGSASGGSATGDSTTGDSAPGSDPGTRPTNLDAPGDGAGGWDSLALHRPDEAAHLRPRSRKERMHDALAHAFTRYLTAGLGGSHDKNPVQILVTVPAATLDSQPGALPARGASGAPLPTSLIRRWACDSALTRVVMGLAGKVIEISHTERTLKAHERRALYAQTGGACQGAGCPVTTADPTAIFHAHHADPFASVGATSLSNTVLFCSGDHAHVHGGHVVRLKDGRRLGPDGWVT